MDERLKKLEEIRKKKEDLEIAKTADRLMAEGGTDSDPAIAQMEDDCNATRQLYSAIGHQTLQSGNDAQTARMMENAKPSLPYHDNQSQNLKKHISDS
jgi:hypothetical protein